METLLESGADDIKLITAVDERDRLSHHEQRGAVLSALHGRLARWPSERFPLLRMKVHTVLSPAAIGLEQVATGRPYRCYIPLTERTVDATHYYPCSVYLREGGAPLGDLTDSADQQRDRSVKFVTGHDCRKDPICARYCLHCTRLYNDDVNQAARGERVDEPPPAHYLVLSPLGLRMMDALSEALRTEGVQVGRTYDLHAWADAADQLYHNERRPDTLADGRTPNPQRSAQYHRAWRERYPEDRGAIWEIPEPDQFRHLAQIKRALRLRFPNEWVGAGQGGAPDLFLHAFHVPEEADLPGAFQRTAPYRNGRNPG